MTDYEIRVAGHLSDDLLTAFPLLLAEPETVLHGHLPDQAALSGVLNRLDELGVEIIELVRKPEIHAPSIRHGRTMT